MSNELKRCPFCDGMAVTKVEITSFGGNSNNKILFCVECEKCGTMKAVTLSFPIYSNFFDIEKAMDNVIKIWNKRAYE